MKHYLSLFRGEIEKFLDFLLPQKMKNVGFEELERNRIYLSAQIVLFLLLLCSTLMYQFGYYYNEVHMGLNWLTLGVHTSIILFHRFIPSLKRATFIAAINMYVCVVGNAFYSGGLFANDLFFLLSIALVVFSVSDKKAGIVFAILSYLSLIIFALFHNYQVLDFREMDNQVPWEADLGNIIFFLSSGFIIAYIYSRGHEKIKQKLNNLQDQQVDELNRQVAIKTAEIKSSSLELEKLRQDIARDFHDEVGNRLAAFNVLIAMTKLEFKRDSESEKLLGYLNKLENTSNEIHQQSRDFLWSIGQMSHLVIDVFTYIRDFAANEFEIQDFQFSVSQNIENPNFELGPNMARQIVLISKEAIVNCVRHSKATSVELSFMITPNLLCIKLKDDGVGLSESVLKEIEDNGKRNKLKRSGMGLLGMKHRALSVDMNLNFENLAERGFCVTMEVPIG